MSIVAYFFIKNMFKNALKWDMITKSIFIIWPSLYVVCPAQPGWKKSKYPGRPQPATVEAFFRIEPQGGAKPVRFKRSASEWVKGVRSYIKFIFICINQIYAKLDIIDITY